MDPGKLDKEVIFYSPADGEADEHGLAAGGWNEEETVWANITQGTTPEVEHAKQRRGLITHKITIRQPIAFTPLPSWRIHWGERVFEINSIAPIDGRASFLVLGCYERLAGAT